MVKIDSLFNEKISKSRKLKTNLNSLIRDLTFQGVPNLLRTQRTCLKLMWIFFITASSLGCIYTITKSVTEYLNFEIVTKIKSYTENVVQFPVVLICDADSTSFEFEVLSMYFGYYKLKSWKDHLEVYNDPGYGRCYRFNSGKNYYGDTIPFYNISAYGPEHCFQINFYANNSDEFGQYKVHIHNQTNTPTTVFNRGHYISTGGYNFFELNRVFEQKLAEPYNSCLKDYSLFQGNRTLIDYIQKSNRTYSQKLCFNFCQTLKYIEENTCNCTVKSYDEDVYSSCFEREFNKQNEYFLDCSMKYLKRLEMQAQEICSNYCPLECDSFEYVISHYTQNIPYRGSIKRKFEFTEFGTYENVSKNFVSISIYFENTKYTHISEYPKMQLFDLISSIGGIFGLFLGISLLSFVEVVEIVLEAVFIITEKKTNC